MKLPREVSADRLVRLLQKLGYQSMRQKGSHLRLRHPGPPAHALSVPLHRSLKTGTLHGLLTDISEARGVSLNELIDAL